VNAVKWLGGTEIVSVSDDGCIAVWTSKDRDPRMHESWELKVKDVSFKDCLNYLSVLQTPSGDNFFSVMSMDGRLRLFKNGDQLIHQGTLLFGKNLQEAMEMTLVGKNYLLLIVGGYDKNIHCYTCPIIPTSEPETHFSYKFSLTGHMDSLKDFSFTYPKVELPNELQLLASCSQDNNIRLWKLQPLKNVQ